MWKFLTSSRATSMLLPSPDGRFVAVVGDSQELMGNYLAPFALWVAAKSPTLLYHREGYSAHAVGQAGNPLFACWSECSNWLAFYEFKRQASYQLAFIHLPEQVVYRVPATDALVQQLPELSKTHAQISTLLQQESATKSAWVQDKAPTALRP